MSFSSWTPLDAPAAAAGNNNNKCYSRRPSSDRQQQCKEQPQQEQHQEQQETGLLEQIPQILEAQHIRCFHHTPESAKKLHETYGFFANGREMSHEVEQHLFDAFIDDDYDGLLHLSTLHSFCASQEENHEKTNDKDHESLDIGPPMGLVFWRQVPDDEMKDWFDWNHVLRVLASSRLGGNHVEGTTSSGTHTDRQPKDEEHVLVVPSSTSRTTTRKRRRVNFVRQNSVESIQNMIKSLHLSSSSSWTLRQHEENSAQNELIHAWIKLELIAVRECFWGRHLGSLLLACALYNAQYKYDQSRVVLHVAGGDENLPAVKLYERFGFLPIQQGTAFQKPDKYMYVLGDIRFALRHTMWTGETTESLLDIQREENEQSNDTI